MDINSGLHPRFEVLNAGNELGQFAVLLVHAVLFSLHKTGVRREGIPQATISAIENDRVRLGVERAKVLARALKCHPGVLVFPGWSHEEAA